MTGDAYLGSGCHGVEKTFVLMALFQYPGWVGQIDPDMTYPKAFEIDSVRVYAQEAE